MLHKDEQINFTVFHLASVCPFAGTCVLYYFGTRVPISRSKDFNAWTSDPEAVPLQTNSITTILVLATTQVEYLFLIDLLRRRISWTRPPVSLEACTLSALELQSFLGDEELLNCCIQFDILLITFFVISKHIDHYYWSLSWSLFYCRE